MCRVLFKFIFVLGSSTFASTCSSSSPTQGSCLHRGSGDKETDDTQHANWDSAVRQKLPSQAIGLKEDFPIQKREAATLVHVSLTCLKYRTFDLVVV